MSSQCTCSKDKEITCIVHPTTRALKERIAELEGLINEMLCDMAYHPASLGELWLVPDDDITAMEAAVGGTE